MARWCKQCQQEGHRKWLWLGTHRTHRIYIRWQMRGVKHQLKKEGKI